LKVGRRKGVGGEHSSRKSKLLSWEVDVDLIREAGGKGRYLKALSTPPQKN